MVRKDVIRSVSERTGYHAYVCEPIVKETFKVIFDELAAHGYVNIINFGTFYVHDKAETTYYNPLTQEPTVIEARRYPRFRYAPALKDAVK